MKQIDRNFYFYELEYSILVKAVHLFNCPVEIYTFFFARKWSVY